MKKVFTLCIVERDGKILLGMKKRGFGEGRWNGFGGKVEDGETVDSAARRELMEEVGIEAVGMQELGVLDFSFENDPKALEVHIFLANDSQGEPKESEEMRPEWFSPDEIPFRDMWPDDEQWFPFVLTKKVFRGRFHFDAPATAAHTPVILSQELHEV